MKKLLLGTGILSFFAISITLIQTSCSKTIAQNTNTTTQINKIIYYEFSNSAPVVFKTCNYDGTGIQNLNIPLPAGYSILSIHHPVLSPDGTKVFFAAVNNTTSTRAIFTFDIGGSNVTKILDAAPGSNEIQLGGAY